MSDSLAPRRAERLLQALGADTDFRDSVLGDLAEEFGIRLEFDGPKAARRWYYGECLRVAPYLLRDWCRNLRWKHVGYFANVVFCSSLCVMVLEWLLKRGVIGMLFIQGNAMHGFPPSAGFAALMLLWTSIDGVFAGYVAARIGRRAPLQSALLVALTWIAVMIGSGWQSVPPWFLAANVTTMLAAATAGGALRTFCAANAR
ncbi:MAG: hypothetical protein ACREMQ_03430 [Longimicrobiales bacterium]